MILAIANSIEFSQKDYSLLLSLIEDNENFIKLQIFLYEKEGNYLSSFRLNMNHPDLRLDIFKWIDKKLELLSENTIDEDERYGLLKNSIAKQMREIIEIDVDKTIELIERWYDDKYSDNLILAELNNYPIVQFNFLQRFLHWNEMAIKLTINEAALVMDDEKKK